MINTHCIYRSNYPITTQRGARYRRDNLKLGPATQEPDIWDPATRGDQGSRALRPGP